MSNVASTSTINETPESVVNSVDPNGTDVDQDDEDEDDVITGVSQPPTRIVLTKRTYLLVTFVIITIMSIAATSYFFIFYLDEYDLPPTKNSEESVRNSLQSLFALMIITPIGFVILKFRITNLLVGVIYLFLLVLCLIFPAKAIAYAIYSLTEDKPDTIEQYVENPKIPHKLHNFWAAFQNQFECCGTLEIDKVEDWPYLLNSTNLPATCCTKAQKNYISRLGINVGNGTSANPAAKYRPELDPKTSYCGTGLGRTRNKGLGFGKDLFKRPFSGFYLSLTDKQKLKIHEKLSSGSKKFLFDPNSYPVDILDIITHSIITVGAHDAFMKNWKNFYLDNVCNTVDELRALNSSYNAQETSTTCASRPADFDNDIAYPADMLLTTAIEGIGVIRNITDAYQTCLTEGWILEPTTQTHTTANASDEYCGQQVPKTRQNATTVGRELLVRLDYLTTYIYEFAEGKQKVKDGTWMLWSIPTRFNPPEIYPFKLNANYQRLLKLQSDAQNAKKMYYFSRGIAENILLKKVIHDKSCEFLDSKSIPSIKKKIARDLNKRWRKSKPFSDWKNIDEGLGNFFLLQVRKIMFVTLGVSTCAIFCVVILAVVFWQYYSRIKAEEYANLALPKEFEVLHLRRGSLIDDNDIVKETKKPKPVHVHRGRKVGPYQLQRRRPPGHYGPGHYGYSGQHPYQPYHPAPPQGAPPYHPPQPAPRGAPPYHPPQPAPRGAPPYHPPQPAPRGAPPYHPAPPQSAPPYHPPPPRGAPPYHPAPPQSAPPYHPPPPQGAPPYPPRR